jgi:CheY-like chemotaxis protein
MRILVVEDDAEDWAALQLQLEKADLHTEATVITDGGTALAYLSDERHRAEELRLVFLNLELPSLSGCALLEAIRAEERLRHLPVILMTSSPAPEVLDRCHALGISSFVGKPVTFTAFANAVADALGDKATSLKREPAPLIMPVASPDTPSIA